MRKAAILALCLFTAAGLAGCGDFAPPADTQTVPAASQQVPAEREATLRLYLPDEDGMHVSLCESKVPAKQMTLKNALVQLIRLDREQKYPLLPTGLTIKDVSIEDGTAVINFSGQLKDLSGGTTAQGLFIAMFVNTATEFPNVRQVVFQMEGQPVTGFTGHYDMTQPFKRNEGMIRMEKK